MFLSEAFQQNFTLGSLLCESCQMILSAAFKDSVNGYHMQGLGLFQWKNYRILRISAD